MTQDQRRRAGCGQSFAVHDLLRYFVPAVVICLGVYAHSRVFGLAFWADLWARLSFPPPGAWYEYAAHLLVAAVLIHVLGHLLAFLSTAFIDKMFINRIYGHPFERLFDRLYPVPPEQVNKRRLAQAAHLFAIAAVTMLVITPVPLLWPALTLLAAAVNFGLKAVYSSLRKHGRPRAARAVATVSSAVLLPACLLHHLIVTRPIMFLFQTHRRLYPTFQDAFAGKFQRVFGLSPLHMETNVYWLVYAHVAERSAVARRTMHHWLGLCGLNRNLSMAMLVLLVYGGVAGRIHGLGGPTYTAWAIVTALAAAGFLGRYFYLYYGFTKYVFRTFVALDGPAGGGATADEGSRA